MQIAHHTVEGPSVEGLRVRLHAQTSGCIQHDAVERVQRHRTLVRAILVSGYYLVCISQVYDGANVQPCVSLSVSISIAHAVPDRYNEWAIKADTVLAILIEASQQK